MLFHGTSNRGTARWTTRHWHYISQPVQLVRVEIAPDQLRFAVAQSFINHGPKLIEALLRVDAGVEMHVPDPQVAPTGLQGSCHGKPVSAAEAKIACLQISGLDLGNCITAYES